MATESTMLASFTEPKVTAVRGLSFTSGKDCRTVSSWVNNQFLTKSDESF